MSHTRIALVLLFSIVPMAGFAADRVAAADAVTTAAVTAAAAAAAPAADTAASPLSLVVRQAIEPAGRPKLLDGLCAATIALQGYDAYSTLAAVHAGNVELNPMMKPIVGNPALFITLKAGIAASTVYSAQKMWKQGQRAGAIAVMLISNGFMTWVDVHNAALLRGGH